MATGRAKFVVSLPNSAFYDNLLYFFGNQLQKGPNGALQMTDTGARDRNHSDIGITVTCSNSDTERSPVTPQRPIGDTYRRLSAVSFADEVTVIPFGKIDKTLSSSSSLVRDLASSPSTASKASSQFLDPGSFCQGPESPVSERGCSRISMASDTDLSCVSSEGHHSFDDRLDKLHWGYSKAKQKKTRISRWSIRQIQKLFMEVDIEEMYCRYWLRLQRLLLFKLLIIIFLFIVVTTLLFNVVGFKRVIHDRMIVNLYFGCGIVFVIILILLVYVRRVYLSASQVLGFLVWVFITVSLYDYLPFNKDSITPMANVPSVFYAIFVIHTMLPLSRKVSVILGIITGVIDLVVVGILTDIEGSLMAQQLVANATIYLCSNLTGFYHKHLTDIAHRHTFLDTRRFLEADIKYSREREKQSRMRENLLKKILPAHLIDDVKKVLNKKLIEVDLGPKRVFHELLVERHNDVSIVFADIVSFTPLTSALDPSDLVTALNELFGRFDEIAEAHSCLRIKMLGDCYYCVCGLPDHIDEHAQNAVLMGMYMIKVIREIREETGVEKLDMRIGIHTGYVLSGILGLQKWQYDIWSDHVTIANHMESGGLPGKVHLTQTTLQQLGDKYEVVPGEGERRSEFLRVNHIKTYFIADHEMERVWNTIKSPSPTSYGPDSTPRVKLRRRHSVAEYVEGWGAETPFDSFSDYMMERTMPETAEVNRQLERTFLLLEDQEESRGKWERTFDDIYPISLRFRRSDLEHSYNNRRDSTFKFYVSCAFVIFICIMLVQAIQLTQSETFVVSLAVGLSFFIILLVMTTGLKCLNRFPLLPFFRCRMMLQSVSETLITNEWLKATVTILCMVVIFTASVLPVMDCNWLNENFQNGTDYSVRQNSSYPPEIVNTTDEEIQRRLPCLFAPYYLYSCALALVACSVFLRVSHLLKTCMKLIGLVIFNIMFYSVFTPLFELYDLISSGDLLPSQLEGTLSTGIFFITLLVLDRQIEKNLRLDFFCKRKIQEDKEEVKRNELLNELLLGNILPRHVAEHFLRARRPRNELYHQQCKNACVMFAAIPDFKTFFSDIDVTGNECLRLLNEIISCFDKMLMAKKFKGLEKIKTISSTYMVAGGLLEGDDTNEDLARTEHYLVSMVRFAFAMQVRLKQLSEHAFYDYKLRIGINHGEVIAGVVGAQKPQYDIWGDTVNVASRMESQGVINRIQVREETAKMLMRNDIPCEYRDVVNVKGKGSMAVYLVSRNCPLFERVQVLERCDSLSKDNDFS